MQKDRARLLEVAAQNMAELFSKKDRPKNPDETFTVVRRMPLSDTSAAIVFRKTPGGKLAVAWFYWVNLARNPEWRGFFVSHTHLVDLGRIKDLLHKVEQYNYPKNEAGNE